MAFARRLVGASPKAQSFDGAPAPILFGLALHSRRLQVLELEPIASAAGYVARAEPLRHDALKAHRAGVTEYNVTGVCEMLIELQARKARA